MFERFDTPVRCSAGHLFTTIWVPLGSLKADPAEIVDLMAGQL
jgi:hypothetical protein